MPKMTVKEVLAAKTPLTAAKRFHQWLQELEPDCKNITFREVGEWGAPEVMHEEGPFEWASALSGGSSYFAGEFGNYGSPGPFPNGLQGDGWFAEPGYSFSLSFHKN